MEEIVKVITIDTRKSERSIKDLKDDIKALKKELESTTIGSKEFDLKLNQLGQLQKEYKAINEEIVASSKPVQKQMFELARFGENLAKSYSAINAAIGLMSDGNEDLQRTLMKTAYWVQLIQGLSGFAPMLRDIPKLVDKFKDLFKWLNPVNDRINNIAKRISGINLKGLGSIGGVRKADVENIRQYNVEAERQNSFFGQNIQDRRVLQKILQEQKAELESINEKILEQTRYWTATKTELENAIAGKEYLKQFATDFKTVRAEARAASSSFEEYTARVMDEMQKLGYAAEDVGDAIHRTFEDDYEVKLDEEINKLKKDLEDAEIKLNDFSVQQANAAKSIKQTEKALKVAGSAVKSFAKALGGALLWTVIITAILAALGALWKWISGLKSAAKEQRELNRAIDEGAASISAKAIVAFKELTKRYRELGDSAEKKKQFLVEFKKEIEETGLAINNVNDADNAFINNTGAYIQALKDRAKAQAIENEAVRVYQEFLEKKAKKENTRRGERKQKDRQLAQDLVGAGVMTQEEADQVGQFKKLQKEEEKVEKTLDRLFEEMFELEEKSEPYFNKVTEGAKEAADAQKQELEQLAEYYKEARRLFMDARTRELEEIREKYDEQIALAKKHNKDTTLLEQARQREIDEVIKKYNDERLAKMQEDVEKQLQVYQQQIERIRMMNDTSNLREPQAQSFTTEYKQWPGHIFGAGSRFFYQSGKDVQGEYDAQIEYNNQLLELTKSRIEQENELLNKQLEIEGITADRKLEIERTLRENEMALSDAAIKNEADNIAAYQSLQEKKNNALQSSLSVASEIFGAMTTLAGEETKAGKAFAVTQAIIDTYASANAAYSSMAGIPYVGPALGIAAAAAAIASGIANVKTILSTKVSSDVNSVSISSGSVATPPALSTPPIEYTRNLLGDKETDEINKPIKCYVLESDITETQNKVKVTEDNASF